MTHHPEVARRTRSRLASRRRSLARDPRHVCHGLVGAVLLVWPSLLAADEPAMRLSIPLLDERLTVEIRGVPEPTSRELLEGALDEAERLVRITDPDGDAEGGVGSLNRAAGQGPQELSPELLPLLERAVDVCFWSDAAHGALGGRLYRLWGRGEPVEEVPKGTAILEAVAAAACDRLELDHAGGTAKLAEGSRLDLHGFRRGFVVDRIVETLEEQGVLNGWVELGDVRRGFGGGLDGSGWPVLLPIFPGLTQPLDEVWLRDLALAVVSLGRRPITVAGDDFAPVIDQRWGQPALGIVGVVVATELAVDAEAMAFALFALGNREGQFRLGAIRPAPSVLWLLGRGAGTPLVSGHRWSRIRTGQ